MRKYNTNIYTCELCNRTYSTEEEALTCEDYGRKLFAFYKDVENYMWHHLKIESHDERHNDICIMEWRFVYKYHLEDYKDDVSCLYKLCRLYTAGESSNTCYTRNCKITVLNKLTIGDMYEKTQRLPYFYTFDLEAIPFKALEPYTELYERERKHRYDKILEASKYDIVMKAWPHSNFNKYDKTDMQFLDNLGNELRDQCSVPVNRE